MPIKLEVSKGMYEIMVGALPAPYNDMEAFTRIQQIILFRIFKPEAFIPIIRVFIVSELSEDLVNPPLFNIEKAYEVSHPHAPLMFFTFTQN